MEVLSEFEGVWFTLSCVVLFMFVGDCGQVELRALMAERQNTVVCSFDPSNPRITAYDIHEWFHADLRIQENTVSMVQIDGIKRQVFIKFVAKESVHALLRDTAGRVEYKYPNGEIYIVTIYIAGMGTKRVRVANLPPPLRYLTIHFTSL